MTIVVDVIRATTVIAQALAAGYERVVCASEIEDARALAEELGEACVTGGERGGVRIEGFALGNSPAEYRVRRAKALVLTTTNGTRAVLRAVDESEVVLCGSILCLAAVAAAGLAAAGDGDLAIRCAGVRGDVALDDVYVAGRLVALLDEGAPGRFLTDAARTARGVARAYRTPLAALADSQSARDLDGTGLEPDVAACAAESTQPVVPRVIATSAGRATVVDRR